MALYNGTKNSTIKWYQYNGTKNSTIKWHYVYNDTYIGNYSGKLAAMD